MSNHSSKKSSRKSSGPNHRSTLSLQKTEIIIHVYDLLPPGNLASVLWTFGTSLLHSGVVINNKEYAYGGHDRRGLTGVYFTRPKLVPPGGTFKMEILHGFTVQPYAEIEAVIKEASDKFQGTSYNLLTRNCNHFTSYLCEKLTGRPGPAWLNRAASIGVALPCVVPRDWIAPPDFESAEGELLDEEDEAHEGSRMLGNVDSSVRRQSVDGGRYSEADWNSDEDRKKGGSGKGKKKAPIRDTSGRVVPPADRAPTKSSEEGCECPP